VTKPLLSSIHGRFAAVVSTLVVIVLVGATPALAEGPHWYINARSAPSYLAPGDQGEMTVSVINLGDAPGEFTTTQPLVITDVLPKGVRAIGGTIYNSTAGSSPEVVQRKCVTALRCEYAGTLPPFMGSTVIIPIEVEPSGVGGEPNVVKVEGGNVPAAVSERPLKAGSTTPFGIERYELSPEGKNGEAELQAGAHLFQLTTAIDFNQSFTLINNGVPKPAPTVPSLLRNLNTVLPAGLVGDTVTVPQCSEADFSASLPGNSNACPVDTAIGAAVVTLDGPGESLGYKTESVPIFNLVPAEGEPARLGFVFSKVPVTLDTSVKTGDGYAVEVSVKNASQAAEVLSTIITIWGTPGDASHDNARGWPCLGDGYWVQNLEPRPACNPLGQLHPAPYLTMPTTSCSTPLATSVAAQSWNPGAVWLAPVQPVEAETLDGCASLPFEPSLTVTPDQTTTSTPSGLKVDVTVPQATTLSAGGLAEADIGETTVALPEGLTASAGAANGLEACAVAQTGFSGGEGDTGSALESELGEQHFTPEGVSCPDASKIGEVSIHSPLLEHEIKGFVYLGSQDTNPFASPLVLYLIAEDPVSGTRVKLAGEVRIDQATGQLTSTFKNTPPLPFENLELHLFDGQRASQATPAYCRPYTTTATFVPTTGEAALQRASSFAPTAGPNGTPCQASGPLPFSPQFEAGSTSSQAAGYTPFTLLINRPDGDQSLTGIEMTLPAGIAAKLASVTPCPEPAAGQSWSCGLESLIGEATSSSGLGNDPVTLKGHVYLTVGYNGAPFGLLASTEAKAGPFNLGIVNVRSRINVNPTTAAVTITTQPGAKGSEEELPTILKGVPVQLKALNVVVNRPEFEFNPTNCSPMSITGALSGSEGAKPGVKSNFQVANCAALPFAPKLTASVVGQGSKANGTTFSVKIESPGLGQANIHKVDLTIPAKLPSRLTTIQKACLEKVFNANPASCDEGSVIGEGIVHTPVFKNPLRGPAYLVSHGNAAFPDVEFVLQGEGVEIVLDGKTDIKNGVTYSKFETAPDAPFTSFETVLPAGPHSALTPNVPEDEYYSLCKTALSLPTEITGQNGAFIKQETKVAVLGCKSVAGFKVTKAQLLAKALKACRSKYKPTSKKSKRVACEKAARKKYGSKAKKVAKKSSKKK
jgi:hypothetical protein